MDWVMCKSACHFSIPNILSCKLCTSFSWTFIQNAFALWEAVPFGVYFSGSSSRGLPWIHSPEIAVWYNSSPASGEGSTGVDLIYLFHLPQKGVNCCSSNYIMLHACGHASLPNTYPLSWLWIIRHSRHPIQPLYRNTHEVSHQANKQIIHDSLGQTPDKGSETVIHALFIPCKISQTYILNRYVAERRDFPRLEGSWEEELWRVSWLLFIYLFNLLLLLFLLLKDREFHGILW